MQLFVATNLTDLHREASFLSEMLTQVLYGMSCELLEEQGKWCRVRMEDGYEGWAHRPFLTDQVPQTPTHLVTVQQAPIYAEPAPAEHVSSRLLCGTHVSVDDERNEFLHVRPAGTMLPMGWVPKLAMRPIGSVSRLEIRSRIVADARLLTGVYYLWGGNTPWGTDCSGLAWLTHRLSGIKIPRDSHPQFHAASPVDLPYQPGDLFFFRKDDDPNRIGHVGISVGGWRMIHSSRSRNGVYEEDVQQNENLKRTFAGAGSFIPR